MPLVTSSVRAIKRRGLRAKLALAALVPVLAGLGIILATGAGAAGTAVASSAAIVPAQTSSAKACKLGNGVKHVIILQFDNVHNERDNASVPSDLEQIPALRNFLVDNGTLLTDDHTVLISHTSNGITSTETGLYPDRGGVTVGNSYQYYDPSYDAPAGSNVGGSGYTSAFKYWTDPVAAPNPTYNDPGDTTFNNDTTAPGTTGTPNASNGSTNTPAPWAPYTSAGCDFAGIGSANMEFENDTTDISNVFGANSTQAAFGNWSYSTAYKQKFTAGSNLGTTDFEGLAIHCSIADSQPGKLCSAANGGAPDALPDEPGGYKNYNALFGAVNVNPALTGKPDQQLPSSYLPSGDTAPPAGNWAAPAVDDVFAPNATDSGPHAVPVNNIDASVTPPPASYTPGSTPTTQIQDDTGNVGFPGFNGMEANNALGYTAAAQEAGVPVTYTYLSDVHDDQYRQNGGNAYGPGQAGYEAQLKEYNAAFTAFFRRLNNDGINRSNTLFLVTVDEGDHFAGSAPTNPGCNGTPVGSSDPLGQPGTGYCNYGSNIGETDINLNSMVKGDTGDTTPFDEDYDDAPAVSVQGDPGPNASTTRNLEKEISGLSEFDPSTGATAPVVFKLADQETEKILHEWNADPLRDPTFTDFGNDDFYVQDYCVSGATTGPNCEKQNPTYDWNHGDDQEAIASTWQGWVGPDVAHLGVDSRVWTDHTDAEPTLMTLTGLRSDYLSDGRPISQIVDRQATPRPIADDEGIYDALSSAYKQLNAPFGEFAQDALNISTGAVTKSDAQYEAWDAQLAACQALRQPLATDIDKMLNGASFGGGFNSREAWSDLLQSDRLLRDIQGLQHASTPPSHPACSSASHGFGGAGFGGSRGPGSHGYDGRGWDRGYSHRRGR
ncbi:MAG TPA: hypothetical protein VMF14_06655 [Solirubrobacteraceae bacterium]|nr:hypothetical protein [Solirubrobacteraceae bacterium]